jgi:hypothetical protein
MTFGKFVLWVYAYMVGAIINRLPWNFWVEVAIIVVLMIIWDQMFRFYQKRDFNF